MKAITLYLVVIVIFIAYAIAVFCGISDSSKRGQFGDAFGAINALFTGLAFAGVAYSLYMQQQENKKRDKEFAEQREHATKEYRELVRSNDVLAGELKAMQATAKLSALPALIESELVHLETHHKDDKPQILIRTCTIETLSQSLKDAEHDLELLKRAEAGDNLAIPANHRFIMGRPTYGHFACCVENLRQLHRYRKDLVDIYRALKT
jgi:hypothetical protein